MTTPRLVVRPAREAELGRIVELFALGAVPGGAPSTEDPDDLGPYRAAWRDIVDGGIGRNGDVVLVAVLAGEVVGVCQLLVFRHLQARGGLCAELESVHVHPDHRGTGVGGALLREAIERARALGCYRVQLTSNAGRPDAHRFYERLGFVPSHVGFKLLLQPAAVTALDHLA
jgi:GNAT superfamily N-acetyltransferase